MGTNISEVEKTSENGKNRTKSGQKSGKTHPKNSARYWESRVRLRPGLNNGLYYARLSQNRRDAWVCLDTANREAAGRVAKKYYETVRANGLDALLAEIKRKRKRIQPPGTLGTVGALLTAARSLLVPSTTRPRTFAGYESGLRRNASDLAGIKGDASRFDYKTGGAERWRNAADAAPLSVLTKEAVLRWRNSFIEAAGRDLAAQHSRTISADSMIRCAKALFSPALRESLAKLGVSQPAQSPFAGITMEKSVAAYTPTVSAADLYAAAWRELQAEPDLLLAFCLLIGCGLRRSEADTLIWTQINLADGQLTITDTPFFAPKSKAARRRLLIPPDAIRLLRERRCAAPQAEFVLDGTAPRGATRSNTYRASAWSPLTAWLRRQGVRAKAPLHELRKAAGSLINTQLGLAGASKFLGHGDLQTTSDHYLYVAPQAVNLGATGPKPEASR